MFGKISRITVIAIFTAAAVLLSVVAIMSAVNITVTARYSDHLLVASLGWVMAITTFAFALALCGWGVHEVRRPYNRNNLAG